MTKSVPSVFTPQNEPYLGREALLNLDHTIISCLAQNATIAPLTHLIALSDAQKMACQVVPQGISIGLSIRELIRQGYLFGAHVLVRPLVERATILMYLHEYPDKIELWNGGWQYDKAPKLSRMIEDIQRAAGKIQWRGYQVTAHLNILLHGGPDSAVWSVALLGENSVGHSPSKILNRPDLCDEVCKIADPMLQVLQSMMIVYFPSAKPA